MVPGSPARRRRKEGSTIADTTEDVPVGANTVHVTLGTSPSRQATKPSKTRQDRKRFRRKHDDEESSFFVLVLKVGSFLACLLLFAFALHTAYWRVYPSPVTDTADFDDDAFNLNAPSEQQQQEHDPELDKLLEEAAQELANEKLQLQEPRSATLKPIPTALAHLNVSDWSSQSDVYGLAERFQRQQEQAAEHASNNSQQLATFWRAAQSLRSEFAEKYGGENAARYILEHGLNRFVGNESFNFNNASLPNSLVHTACRIKQAQLSNRPFRFVFGGYSVTNGRGNYFAQSYPFVMEQLLHTPFYLLGVQLKVSNHAIGGCPSFPYGWCLLEFMGTDADVISWDFGMNEAGGDPVGLEAYVRQVLTQLPQRPMLIVKDTPLATQRRELLQHYTRLLNDPLLLVSDAAADWFLELPQSQRPSGFAEWRKFGAPPGAPGQVVHHPGVKEHEFIAWILTMHFLSILEIVAADDGGDLLQCLPLEAPLGTLPRPLAVEATQTNLTKPWTAMFFGQASAERDNDMHWSMNRIHCRTTFEPIVKGDLSSLVVVGSVGENVNVMLPKSNMFYNRGWVLDMSDQEKKAKRKLELFGDLGFIDSKKAYYGLFTSKAMRLLLPYDGNLSPRPGDLASSFFRSIVVCEVNEKRDYGACDLSQDVLFMIGGVNATSAIIEKTVFMGKKICVHLQVPDAAVFSTRALIKEQYALPSGLLPPPETEKDRVRDAKIGLEVQIRVINQRIMSLDKACSVSHVVWEEATATAYSVSSLESASNNVTK